MAEALKPPPKQLGVTHWSSRLLAKRLTIVNASVARAGRAHGIKPRKAESSRFSAAPGLVGKVTSICGLLLAPPENPIALCVDEQSQIQALDREGWSDRVHPFVWTRTAEQILAKANRPST